MSKESINQTDGYQETVANTEAKPEKKQSTAAAVASTVGGILLYKLFGILGAAICLGGFAGIMAIAKSKLPTAAKVILGVMVGILCIGLLGVFILISASLTS